MAGIRGSARVRAAVGSAGAAIQGGRVITRAGRQGLEICRGVVLHGRRGVDAASDGRRAERLADGDLG
jgi:hypothetical protein